MYLNIGGNGGWRSVPFASPSTMDTLVIDQDLKNKVKSDLESFLKSKHYYHRLGRAWRRSYLLHGPSGTGKSTFISALSAFLSYDVYRLDLFRVADDSQLEIMLLKTTSKSVIVVEDLDRWFLREKQQPATTTGGVSLSGILNFMDGITSSCCSDERLFVFTASRKDFMDPDMLRPGRVDVHIHFPLCDFSSFKSLASSYLGLKDHKLFPQVEEVFSAAGAAMSAAEIGEIMIANRSSPTRALKTVISALQTNADVAKGVRRLSCTTSSKQPATGDEIESGRFKDSPVKELPRKLYGLLRLKSSSKIGPLDHNPTKEDISR